jgi:hypothetical protein
MLSATAPTTARSFAVQQAPISKPLDGLPVEVTAA